jgi:hypothetical protein
MVGFVFFSICWHINPMNILLGLLFTFLPTHAATLVSESVGQAGEYVITSREVQISNTIEDVLFSEKPVTGILEVRPDQAAYRNAVANVLLEVVVAFEAENFNVGTVAPDDLSRALLKIEKSLGGKPYWTRLEITTAELQKFTSRKLVAKSFLKFKSNSMVGIITDQEAQSYYDKNRIKFGSMPFSNFKENIKTYLAQQQLEERLRSWFEVIKRKYKVRNLLPSSV